MTFRIHKSVFGSAHPQIFALGAGAIGVTLFVTPLLFLPISLDHWEIVKTVFALLGVVVALLSALFLVWCEKRLPNIWHRGDIAWAVFCIAALLSLFLSVHPITSLFGIRGDYSEGAIGLMSLLLLFTCTRIFLRDVRVLLIAFWLLIISFTLGALLFLFGVLGFPALGSYSTFPLLANSLTIVSIGSVLSLAVLLYVLFRGAGHWKMLTIGGATIHALLLFILDLNIAWYLLFFLLLFMSYLLSVRGMMNRLRIGMLAFIGIVVALALFFDLAVITKASLVPDVLLGQNASAHITWDVLRAHPVTGSGPATFLYDYMRNASPGLYAASGGAQFVRAGSQWWQWISTLGIGVLVLFGIIIGILVRVFLSIVPNKKNEDGRGPLALDLVFLLLAGIFFASIFFPLHFSILIMLFFLLGAAETLFSLKRNAAQDSSIPKDHESMFRIGAVALGLTGVLATFFMVRVLAAEISFGSALHAAETQEDLTLVEQRLRRAVDLAPWDASLLASLGEQQAIQGAVNGDAASRADDVQRFFAEARKKNPLQPAIVSAQLRAHTYLGAASPYTLDDLENMLQARITQEPGQATHYLAYAQFALEVYEQQQGTETDTARLTQAQDLLKQAKDRNPYLPGIDYTQARIYSLTGKHQEAISLLESLMQLYPSVQDFRDALIKEYEADGQADKAAALKDTASTVQP